jgi:hypothetical protein
MHWLFCGCREQRKCQVLTYILGVDDAWLRNGLVISGCWKTTMFWEYGCILFWWVFPSSWYGNLWMLLTLLTYKNNHVVLFFKKANQGHFLHASSKSRLL